jgi:hypothetical protein
VGAELVEDGLLQVGGDWSSVIHLRDEAASL